jgi:hypothetical protein
LLSGLKRPVLSGSSTFNIHLRARTCPSFQPVNSLKTLPPSKREREREGDLVLCGLVRCDFPEWLTVAALQEYPRPFREATRLRQLEVFRIMACIAEEEKTRGRRRRGREPFLRKLVIFTPIP